MKTVLSFIKTYIRELVFVLLLGIEYILCACGVLSGGKALVSAIVILVVWALLFVFFLMNYRKKDKQLLTDTDTAVGSIVNNLPRPSSVLEADYQRLLKQLYSEKLYAETADEREYARTTVSLDKIIRNVVQSHASELEEKNIVFKYKTVIKNIKADSVWLNFIFNEIICNAIEKTENGMIGVYLERDHVLCFEDSGEGMSGEELEKLFAKNGKIHKMYICRLACERMGIRVSAESEPGKGTRILLRL